MTNDDGSQTTPDKKSRGRKKRISCKKLSLLSRKKVSRTKNPNDFDPDLKEVCSQALLSYI